jgi:hypothetical protein
LPAVENRTQDWATPETERSNDMDLTSAIQRFLGRLDGHEVAALTVALLLMVLSLAISVGSTAIASGVAG